MNARRLIVGALLVGAGGCVSSVGESFQRYGLPRASFEMQCPSDQLQQFGLNAPLESHAYVGSQVGVEGCGHRVVYVLTPSGWLANAPSGALDPAAFTPPPPAMH